MSTTPQWALNEIKRVKSEKLKGLWIGRSYNGQLLQEIPVEIGVLTEIEVLSIEGNFQTIPVEIGNLKNLRSLSLTGYFQTIPDELSTLKNLSILQLSGHYSKIPEWIAQFNQLTKLFLSGRYSGIPPWMADIRQLTSLYLNGFFAYIPDWIGDLTNLNQLYLDGEYSTLPLSIYKLRKLKKLELRGTGLKAIDAKFIDLINLETFNIKNIAYLQSPPREIVLQGLGAIREYFNTMQTEENDYLYETKLIILGEGGAGKTTLARKIQDENAPMPNPEDTTHGIKIEPWYFVTPNARRFRVNIWDFAGQEIYHTTHQYFLTSRSVYTLVCDNRRDDTDFTYWLHIVELLSDNSPLIIVNNEQAGRKSNINERQLRSRFNNIMDIRAVNLLTKDGLETLTAEICHQVEKLPHIGTPLPKSWVNVRYVLEEDNRNYISYEDYLAICEKAGIHDETRKEIIIGFLHDLGVCLHFKNDPLLKRWVILKPHWGTTATYAVLDSRLVFENQGRFTARDLESIWGNWEYRGMHSELLQLMLNFRLCYLIPGTDTYIAPQLLSKNQKDYNWDRHNNLQLRYEYDFMPRGIISRFIVAMHKEIKDDLVWQTGVVLEYEGTMAEIMEDYSGKKILIRVVGKEKQSLRGIIARELDEIHTSFKELKYEKFVPCSCSECVTSTEPHFFTFEALRRADERNREIQCQKSFIDVNPQQLLQGIYELQQSTAAIEGEFDIFLSYARANQETMFRVKDELEKHGLRVWVDRERIEIGAKSWKQEIQDGLDASACLVFIATPASKKSRWVQNEIGYADNQKKPVFAILADGSVDTSFAFYLTDMQHVDIQREFEDNILRLIQAIKKRLRLV